jgi:hypothetical protein
MAVVSCYTPAIYRRVDQAGELSVAPCRFLASYTHLFWSASPSLLSTLTDSIVSYRLRFPFDTYTHSLPLFAKVTKIEAA